MASRIIHLAITDCIQKGYRYKDKNRLELGSILPDAVTSGNSHLKNILVIICIWYKICFTEILCMIATIGIHCCLEMSKDYMTTMHKSINMLFKNMPYRIRSQFLLHLMRNP